MWSQSFIGGLKSFKKSKLGKSTPVPDIKAKLRLRKTGFERGKFKGIQISRYRPFRREHKLEGYKSRVTFPLRGPQKERFAAATPDRCKPRWQPYGTGVYQR